MALCEAAPGNTLCPSLRWDSSPCNFTNEEPDYYSNTRLTARCDEADHLVELSFTGVGLSGHLHTIHEEILSTMQHIRHIDLSHNSLSGSCAPAPAAEHTPLLLRPQCVLLLPRDLVRRLPAALLGVEHLSVEHNLISGTLPSGEGSQLLEAYVTQSILQQRCVASMHHAVGHRYRYALSEQTGRPVRLPDGADRLSFLGLEQSRLSGTLPTWLGSFPSLSYLSLSSSRISGARAPTDAAARIAARALRDPRSPVLQARCHRSSACCAT